MHKLYKLFVMIGFILLLTSCSQQTDNTLKSHHLNQQDELEEAIQEQALLYAQSIQNSDYETAFSMLSTIYTNAGITLEDFTSDFIYSNLDLSQFDINIRTVRDRVPSEISQTNMDELFYQVSVQFDSKGETREDYSRFVESGVKWIDKSMWFHYENGNWKFFAIDDQKGVTWKPDAYATVNKLLKAIQNGDTATIYSIYSNYYKETGLTEEKIKHHLIDPDGNIVSFVIDKVTDDLRLDSNDQNILPTTMLDKFVRVTGNFGKEDYPGFNEVIHFDFEWFFHLEDGEWKFLTTDFFNVRKHSMYCFLTGDCENGEPDKQTDNNAEERKAADSEENSTDLGNNSTNDKSGGNYNKDPIYSIEMDEITTDLEDGNFVRIQFQFITDTENSKEDLIKRDFQVRNILIRELSQMTADQIENNEEYLINIQEQINQLLHQGELVDIYIINKIIQ